MLVSRGIHETAIQTNELMIIEAFSGGWATTYHFDCLCDMRNALVIAAEYKKDESAKVICEAMRVTMHNLRDRHTRTGKMGASGDELQVMRAFSDYYRDFWIRQPTLLYAKVCDELGQYNQSVATNRLPT